MNTDSPDPLFDLDFDHLTYYAYKRYIEGVQTIELMEQATSDREKEEIALVTLLDVQTDLRIVLTYHKPHANAAQLNNFRQVMQQLINAAYGDLGKLQGKLQLEA